MQVLTNWFRRYFSDPQIVFLTVSLLVGFAIVLTMGDMLGPVLASIVIAYLLEGLVAFLQRHGWRRISSVSVVYSLFILFVVLILFGIMPLVSRQVTDLVQQLPLMISEGQKVVMELPERYPDIISTEQIQNVIGTIHAEIATFGQQVLSWSLASVVGIITLFVYMILVPLLVFFFLKDRDLILGWCKRYLPKHRRIAGTVWRDVDRYISNYVRGKFWEILIIWAVSYVTFYAFGLNYAMLLGMLVGLSVIVPYIGASIVTLPVLLIAWFQWDGEEDTPETPESPEDQNGHDDSHRVQIDYLREQQGHQNIAVQGLDQKVGPAQPGKLGCPIPLATLVQAILSAWPHHDPPCPESEVV